MYIIHCLKCSILPVSRLFNEFYELTRLVFDNSSKICNSHSINSINSINSTYSFSTFICMHCQRDLFVFMKLLTIINRTIINQTIRAFYFEFNVIYNEIYGNQVCFMFFSNLYAFEFTECIKNWAILFLFELGKKKLFLLFSLKKISINVFCLLNLFS